MGVRAATYLFAVSILPIGLSHIVYVDATAGFVPHWLPAHRAWAYITGAGQIATGLGVLFGVLPRIAAWAEAGQITVYTLLVWLPALLADAIRLNRTAFFISWIFGAAVGGGPKCGGRAQGTLDSEICCQGRRISSTLRCV